MVFLRSLQIRLAAMRTDLDSFTDVEAYALMTSGYLMTGDAFNNTDCVEGFAVKDLSADWKFLSLKDAMVGETDKSSYI